MRTQGSIALYRKIDKALGKLYLRDPIWISIVSVVDAHARIVRLLDGSLALTVRVDGARLGKCDDRRRTSSRMSALSVVPERCEAKAAAIRHGCGRTGRPPWIFRYP